MEGLKKSEKLSNYTNFKIGGPADYFYILKDAKKLPELIKFAKKNKLPYIILGRGTNVVFDDKGFRGLVIKNELQNIKITKNLIEVESGVLVARLIQEAMKNGLSELEKWVGLPGTVGGAVRGNAGCNSLETKDILISAKIFNPKNCKFKTVKNSYFKFKYRDSILKKNNEILISATFRLSKNKLSKEDRYKLITEISGARSGKQPSEMSAGSFFKNPSKTKPAGMLIEQSGLKGKAIGGAKISEKHANFIINKGNAKSSDIVKLAKLIKRVVKAKFGTSLKEEVQIFSTKGRLKL